MGGVARLCAVYQEEEEGGRRPGLKWCHGRGLEVELKPFIKKTFLFVSAELSDQNKDEKKNCMATGGQRNIQPLCTFAYGKPAVYRMSGFLQPRFGSFATERLFFHSWILE